MLDVERERCKASSGTESPSAAAASAALPPRPKTPLSFPGPTVDPVSLPELV